MMAIDFMFESNRGWVGYKHEITPAPPSDCFSMHTHNHYEIIYFLSGDATHVIEDRKYKLKPGDLILIQPLKYHFIQVDSSVAYERFNVGLDDTVCGTPLCDLLSEVPEIINFPKEAGIELFFYKMNYYRENLSDDDMERLFPSLLTELVYNVIIAARGGSIRHATALNPILSDAIAYINAHLLTLKSISEIADQLFVTESYLFQLFKKELNQTPKRYITDKRLLLAQTRIRRGERPTDVCSKCGFNDYATFYRNYKRFFHKSPSEDAVPDAPLSF